MITLNHIQTQKTNQKPQAHATNTSTSTETQQTKKERRNTQGRRDLSTPQVYPRVISSIIVPVLQSLAPIACLTKRF